MKSGCHHPDGVLWFKTGRHEVHSDKCSVLDVLPTVVKSLGSQVPKDEGFKGRVLPIAMVERHPLGSQAFLPLGEAPFLVVVAPAGARVEPAGLVAFRTDGRQGVNYRKGVWHHPVIALDQVTDFAVIDRGGPGENCDEIHFGADRIVLAG